MKNKLFIYMVLLGSLFSSGLWLAEALIHTHIFKTGSFITNLIPPEENELWMRLFICGSVIIFSIALAVLMNSRMQLKQQLVIDNLAINSVRQGVVITNSYNEIIRINAAYSNVTGYTEEEALGKNPSLLSSDKQDKAFYQSLWRTLNEKGSWEGEVWNRRKSGEYYAEWLSITLVKDEKNRVLYHVGVFTDNTSKKAEDERIKHFAYYDPLTNLPNRLFFIELLTQAITLAKRKKELLAVLFIDLDHFKSINDQYGYLIGDKFLCAVSKILQSSIRDADTVSRFGGDELVILLNDVKSKENAWTLAKKILSNLQQEKVRIDSHQFQIGASIGGALYPDDAKDANDLIKCSDKAMYHVKTSTRGDVLFF